MEDLSNKSKKELIDEIEAIRLQLQQSQSRNIQELIEHKERYDLANKATKDGIYDWNLVSNEIYYNPNWKKMLGYEDDELANDFKVWETHTLPEDVERSWKMQNELINKKRDRFVMEFKMKHKDGHLVDILSRAEAVFDENGKAIRIVGTHVDITEKKKVLEDLRNSEERFRTLTNLAPVGIYLADHKGNCTYANPKWLEMAGLTLEEAMGMGWSEALHPDDRAAIESSWYASHESRITWRHKFRFQTPHGKVTWVHGMADPIYNSQNQLAGYMGVNMDVTEFNQAEDALKESELFLDQIFNSSAVSTWISDNKGVAIRCNPACLRFFGAAEDEVIGKYNLLQDEVVKAQGFLPDVEKVYTEGKVANIVIDYNFGAVDHVDVKNATHKVINSIITPVIKEDGKISNAIIQTIDLSEIKIAERNAIDEKLKAEQYLDIAEVMLLSIDNRGIVQLINPKGCEILGGTKEDIIGKNWFDTFLPEAIKEEVKEVAAKVFAGEIESVKYHENTILTLQGEEKLMAFRNSVFTDDNNRIIGTLSSGEDITERVKQEQLFVSQMDFLNKISILTNKALSKEELLSTVFQETLEYMKVDRIWLLLPCDPSADYWEVEMECSSPDYPGAFAQGEKIVMNKEDAEIIERMQREEGVVVIDFDQEKTPNQTASEYSILTEVLFTLRLTSGETYLCGMHQCSHYRDWSREEKNLFREVGNRISDALNRLIFVNNLENSESKFKSLFDSGLLGILFWNAAGEISDANKVFLNMIGYTKDELLNGDLSWKGLTPPEYEARDRELLAELAEKGRITPFEKEYYHKDGSRIPILIGAATIKDSNDSGVAFIMDITEKKEFEKELHRHRDQLEHMVEERTKALNRKNKELDDALKVFVGRELTIKELQKKIATLEKNK